MTLPRPGRAWIGAAPPHRRRAVRRVACAAGPDRLTRRQRRPGRRPRRRRPPSRSSRPRPNDPFGLIAWLFTPLFQAFFIVLVVLDKVTGNIAIAIVLMTLILRIVLIPVFRRQTVSTKRTQMLAPEVKEIQRRYKGDRLKRRRPSASSTPSAGSTRSPAACRPSSRSSC